MLIFEAIILGIVQGITEFLPISSTGHLVLLQDFLGFHKPLLFFDVAVHVGTLGSIVVYFRKRLWELLGQVVLGLKVLATGKGWNGIKESAPGFLWFYGIVLATLPVVICGWYLKNYLLASYMPTRTIGFMCLVMAGILLLADRFQNGTRRVCDFSATAFIVVGLFQVLALMPGISRAGITLTACLLLRMNRVQAFQFSLLMSIPVLIGAGLLTGMDAIATASAESLWPFLIGAVCSFVFGLLSLTFYYAILERGRIALFAIYMFFLASIIFLPL